MPQSRPLLVAQLSDLHLFATPEQTLLGLRTMASFSAILESVAQCTPRPDLLLLTGDLAQDESPDAYRHIMEQLVPLNIPSYWLPGNHDHPPSMASILSHPPLYTDKDVQVGNWRFLLLDSTVPQEVYGEFSAQRLEALERQLQAHTNPTLIALHHPPVTIDSTWLDNLGLRNANDFCSIIERYPHVKLVIFGHIHQQTEQQRQGVTYLSTPSTCVQFAPQQETFALDEVQPGFRLFWLYPDGSFASKVQRVEISHQLDLTAQGY